MHCHDYAVTRRRFIQEAAGAATLLGMPVGHLLAAKGTAMPAKAEHVILFWNGGGMSHIDTWDPKPGRPTQGEFEAIKTSADGVQISEIFPQLANQMHHCALVRSIAGTNGDHGRATYELQTGYGQSANLVHPGLGSIVVHEKERLGDLPAFVSVSGQAPRSGYLGQKCAAYFVGQPGEPDPYLKFPAGISEIRGNKRLEVLAKMNKRTSKKYGAKDMRANEAAVDDAVALMRSPALKAFEIKHEVEGEVVALDGRGDQSGIGVGLYCLEYGRVVVVDVVEEVNQGEDEVGVVLVCENVQDRVCDDWRVVHRGDRHHEGVVHGLGTGISRDHNCSGTE